MRLIPTQSSVGIGSAEPFPAFHGTARLRRRWRSSDCKQFTAFVASDWHPFSGLDTNIETLLKAIVERLADDQPPQLRGRLIKLQNYQFDELIAYGDDLSPIFTQLSSTGCVVIVDEYSVFHPEIQEALGSSGLLRTTMSRWSR